MQGEFAVSYNFTKDISYKFNNLNLTIFKYCEIYILLKDGFKMFYFYAVLLGLIGWSLMTWVPIGRINLQHRIKTNADLNTLKKIYNGEYAKVNWFPNSKTQKIEHGIDELGRNFTDYIYDDPLPKNGEAYKYYNRIIQVHSDESRIENICTIAMGVKWDEADYLYETLNIENFEDYNLIRIEQKMPRHGLLCYSRSKSHLERYMNCLTLEAGDTLQEVEKPKVQFLALWTIPLTMAAGYYFLNGWFGIFAALIFSLAILLHELGHGLAMRIFGHKFIDIALIPFGGGIAISNQPYKSRFEMAMIALAGPLISAIFMVLLVLGTDAFNMDNNFKFLLADNPMDHIIEMIASLVALSFIFVMLLLNAINLFPKRGLDGGEVIAAISNSKTEYYVLVTLFGAIITWFTYKLELPIWIIAIEIVLITFLLRRSGALISELPVMSLKEKLVSISMLCATLALYAGTIIVAEHQIADLPNSIHFKQYLAELNTANAQ